ncbi:MAG: hemolysin III family protein [Clostridia bacterium]|nr:hemolysin III family protein [Clostridia bacterium]
MKTEKIELVEYTRGEELINVLTHFAGLVLPAFVIIKCLPLARGDVFSSLCAVIYAFGMAASFISSCIYHALPQGNKKRIMRVIDHSAIFFAVSGTVTGCVPVVFIKGYTVSAVLMLIIAWGSVIAGLVLTVFFFNKFRTVRMCIYIFSALFCALAGIKTFFQLPVGAFICLVSGGAVLLIGCVLYRMGAKRRYFHCVFHVFIVAGLGVFCYGIYNYVYLLQFIK